MKRFVSMLGVSVHLADKRLVEVRILVLEKAGIPFDRGDAEEGYILAFAGEVPVGEECRLTQQGYRTYLKREAEEENI